MKTNTNRFLFFTIGLLFSASLASADEYPIYRGQRSEFYLLLQYWTIDSTTLPNVTVPIGPGSGVATVTGDVHYKVDNQVFWGLGFAYNLNEHMAVHAEFAFGRPDYSMTYRNSQLTGTAYVHTGKLNFEYNLLKRQITPFFTAGGGYMYFDTGVPSGPPEYYYWWDYYWGPVLVGTQPTFSNWYWTYNAAAGLRWEVNDRFLLKLSYGGNWVVSTPTGTLLSTETTCSFSMMF